MFYLLKKIVAPKANSKYTMKHRPRVTLCMVQVYKVCSNSVCKLSVKSRYYVQYCQRSFVTLSNTWLPEPIQPFPIFVFLRGNDPCIHFLLTCTVKEIYVFTDSKYIILADRYQFGQVPTSYCCRSIGIVYMFYLFYIVDSMNMVTA